MSSSLKITIFTLVFMLGITAISLSSTDTSKKPSTVEQKTETVKTIDNDEKSQEMKCGAGKCGAGKCGSK